jgi:hypothetical protein
MHDVYKVRKEKKRKKKQQQQQQQLKTCTNQPPSVGPLLFSSTSLH